MFEDEAVSKLNPHGILKFVCYSQGSQSLVFTFSLSVFIYTRHVECSQRECCPCRVTTSQEPLLDLTKTQPLGNPNSWKSSPSQWTC